MTVRSAASHVPSIPWPSEAATALRLGLTSVVAILLAMWLELETPAWAGWTVLSVSLTTRASSLQKSLWRAIGTVVGAVVAFALVGAFAQSTLFFDAALAAWLALVTVGTTVERGQRSYGFALMGFTVPIVTLADVQDPLAVFHVAIDRGSSLLLGIACAHVSFVLVASGVPVVSTRLADRIDAAASSTARWLRDDAGDPPLAEVLALRTEVEDAFTEQPSLQTGGFLVYEAPLRLLHLLAIGMLRRRLRDWHGADPSVLLGRAIAAEDNQHARVRVAARILGSGRRFGNRRAPVRTLAIDRDWRQAGKNALRTALAVSLVNGFWYVSEWPYGASAATWAALVSVLFAARADAADAARSFMLGAVVAAVVAVVVDYTVLITTGDVAVLAAVLLPVGIAGALGRIDKRAVIGSGFGMLVFTFIGPTNVMHYQLDQTLNEVEADLLGMGAAVFAFSGLPPPATPATRRWRAKLRIAAGLRTIARRPRHFLPSADAWLVPMAERLASLDLEPEPVRVTGQSLLLAGLILLALRRDDDQLGRAVGAALTDIGPIGTPALDRLASAAAPLQRDRIDAIARLLGPSVEYWPGLAT